MSTKQVKNNIILNNSYLCHRLKCEEQCDKYSRRL